MLTAGSDRAVNEREHDVSVSDDQIAIVQS
jgi:hypothetical protein